MLEALKHGGAGSSSTERIERSSINTTIKEIQNRIRILSIEGVFGNNLSSRRRRSKRNELYLSAINYNIAIANMTSIKEVVR